MHSNELLLTKYYECLNAHNAEGIANCYHENATFHDIAFNLEGKKQIFSMWDMICSANKLGIPSDISASVQNLSANESTGSTVVLENYTYRDKGRKVNNKITSNFEFLDGLIFKQEDECDPIDWASQALGGISGFVAGRVGFIRRWQAMGKLQKEHFHAFQEK